MGIEVHTCIDSKYSCADDVLRLCKCMPGMLLMQISKIRLSRDLYHCGEVVVGIIMMRKCGSRDLFSI